MKNMMKWAVLAAMVVPLSANAALTYTPPQALVMTCNGQAPTVTTKTSALATFACANGATPQAVGVTSGLGDLLGLASGAAALVGSESVPALSLPGARPTGGSGSNANSGAKGSNGNGSGTNGNGSGSNTGSNTGSNGNSNANGSGSNTGSNANGSGTGSSANSTGSAAAAAASGAKSASSGGGGWLGHLVHNIGQAAGRIGHAMLTGGSVTIPLIESGNATTTTGGGSSSSAPSSNPFEVLNQIGKPAASSPASPMTGAAPGTIELTAQPQPLTFTGGAPAYRGLVQWLSGYQSKLSIGWGNVNEVVHPGTVTPERLPAGGSSFYGFNRVAGTINIYITTFGHKYIAYPGNPIAFVAQVPTRGTSIAIAQAGQNIQIQATGTYSTGPSDYTSVPGNRNGPFWPSPFTAGGPQPEIGVICQGLTNVTHVSVEGYCWSTSPQ